jgi:hypothetical protein
VKIDFNVHRSPKVAAGLTDAKGAVFAPFSFAGNEANSAARYDEIARLTGMDVWTAHSSGTGKIYIDRATRRSLRPGKLRDITDDYAQEVGTMLAGYAVRLGMGDSGRGVWIATMQQASAKPFSHVLIRDGVNLYAPEPVTTGARRLFEHGGDMGDVRQLAQIETPYTLQTASHTFLCGISEAITHRKLMCGLDSVQAVLNVANDPSIPFHNVGLEYGIGGSPQAVRSYNQVLETTRELASLANLGAAPLLASYEKGWGHGALMDPAAAAGHVEQTVTLL